MSWKIDPILRRLIEDLIDVMPASAFLKDRDSRFLAANAEFLERLGQGDGAAVIGRTDYDLVAAEEAHLYVAADREVMERDRPLVELLETQSRSDGSAGVYNTTKLPVHDADGQVVGLVGFTMEVLDPDRVAQQLRTSEQRYALAMRASRDGIWDFDLAANAGYLSPRCCHLLEIGVSTGAVPWSDLFDRLGSQESSALLSALKPLVRDRAESITHTIELELHDGSTRWLEVVGTALFIRGRARRLVGSVADVTADRERREALRLQASRDDLTGLSNRRVLVERIDEVLEAGGEFSLLYLDLDQFKVINDSLGHQAGDEMLLAIAGRLSSLQNDGETLARLGGDEFALLLPGDDVVYAERVGEMAVGLLRDPVELDGLDVYSTLSVGVVHSNVRHGSATDVLRDADIALYRAKDSGKACVRVFTPDMRQDADRELELQVRLRRAVAEKEFRLHYQPIFDAQTLELRGLEALLRWHPPNDPPETPGSFLPYLERSGLIAELGEWVVDEACRQLREWRTRFPAAGDIDLAVNLSRVQFRSDRLVQSVGDAVRRHRIEPSDLILEVTETAVSENEDEIRVKLAQLRAEGMRVAIDDFGIGQSSLSVLYDLPADFVKIDRSFTERLASGGEEPVIDAVLRIAGSLGLQCIAEGVETEVQDTWLRQHGCHLVQGYFHSRPMPAEEIPAWFGEPLDAAA